MLTLKRLNDMPAEEFMAAIGGPLEGETWLAERVAQQRPFNDVHALIDAFQSAIDNAAPEEKIRLIASHPRLGLKVDERSEASQQEQASAGLDRLTEAEYAEFVALNDAYVTKFKFPFVICAREHNKTSILQHFKTRIDHRREQEIEIGAAEVFKILRLRLLDLIKTAE